MALWEQLTFKVTGLTTLLMHNNRLAEPFNAYKQDIDQLVSEGKARGLSKEDKRKVQMKIARLEWVGGSYMAPSHGPIIPARMLLASLREGAKQEREGKTVARGVTAVKSFFPLLYEGPRDEESLWTAGEPQFPEESDMGSTFVDYSTVKIQKATVMRCRPKFDDWSLEGSLVYSPRVIGRKMLISLLELAGMEGLGDGRSIGNGKYTVTDFS